MSSQPLVLSIPYTKRFDSHPQSAELYAMLDAAKGANRILREWFEKAKASDNPDSVLGTVTKSNAHAEIGFQDAMTRADVESEQFILTKLKACRDIPIVAEESGHSVDDTSIPNGGYRWLVDPLDGTFCFKNGNPSFSVTIALQKKVNGKWITEIGLVSHPMHDEIYVADNKQSYLIQGDTEKLLQAPIDRSAAFSGTVDDALRNKKVDICVYNKDNPRVHTTRNRMVEKLDKLNAAMSVFSTALTITQLSDGWLDAVIMGGKGPFTYAWDTDAAIHIAEKAGVKIKRFTIEGEPWMILANNASVLRALENVAIKEYTATKTATLAA